MLWALLGAGALEQMGGEGGMDEIGHLHRVALADLRALTRTDRVLRSQAPAGYFGGLGKKTGSGTNGPRLFHWQSKRFTSPRNDTDCTTRQRACSY